MLKASNSEGSIVASKATKPRKRVQLDRELILDAALRLAQNRTYDAVTVRKLGAELGADPTAIYRHFRDKDELVAAIVDHMLRVALEEMPKQQDWRESLRVFASESARVMVEYPSIGALASGVTTEGPGEFAVIEFILECFTQAGLDPADTVRFYGIYANLTLATSAAMAGYVLSEGDRTPDSPAWLGAVAPVDDLRYPLVAAMRHELSALRDEELFMAGVDIVLDAAETTAKANKKKSRKS